MEGQEQESWPSTPFGEEERRLTRGLRDAAAAIGRLERLRPVLEDITEVAWIGVFDFFAKIKLNPDNKDNQKIVHTITQRLGIKFVKEQEPGAESFCLKGNWEGLEIQIDGYLPPTCRVVYEEQEIPETMVPARRARVARIVCDGEEGEE